MQEIGILEANLDKIKPNQKKALFLAKRQLAMLVCDAVNLEGINYTLPEVQTLLQGVTVGGHKLSDQVITLNQSNAWHLLFDWIESSNFVLDKQHVCALHAVAGKEEALQWGVFREGAVSIAGTDYVPPDANQLDRLWDEMVAKAYTIENIYDRAIFIFLQMSRYQFFYDVNKRMGRFMMNGLLLSEGYPVINLPAKKQLEFNQLMLEFYPTGNVEPMTYFMKSCLEQEIINMMSEV
jgi:Fic family protein